MAARSRARDRFPIHIETETRRSRGPLTGGPLCQQARPAVLAAAHPGYPTPLICPACAARWRELIRDAERA